MAALPRSSKQDYSDVTIGPIGYREMEEKIFSQPFINANRVGGNGVVAYNYIKSKRGDPHVVLAVAAMGIIK